MAHIRQSRPDSSLGFRVGGTLREGVGDVELPQLLAREVQTLELLPNEPARSWLNEHDCTDMRVKKKKKTAPMLEKLGHTAIAKRTHCRSEIWCSVQTLELLPNEPAHTVEHDPFIKSQLASGN